MNVKPVRKSSARQRAVAVRHRYRPGTTNSNGRRVGCLNAIMLEPASTKTSARRDGTRDEADSLLGKVVELRHHGLSRTGVPRHPESVCVREAMA